MKPMPTKIAEALAYCDAMANPIAHGIACRFAAGEKVSSQDRLKLLSLLLPFQSDRVIHALSLWLTGVTTSDLLDAECDLGFLEHRHRALKHQTQFSSNAKQYLTP